MWAYRTTKHTTTGETPFAIAFGVETVIPADVSLTSYQIENYDEENNAEWMMSDLDLLDEKREQALIWTTVHNQVVARYYSRRFHPRIFKARDLVLKKVLVREPDLGSFGPK